MQFAGLFEQGRKHMFNVSVIVEPVGMKSQIGLFLPSCVHYVTVYSEFGSYNDQ
jgi:hypothetical protein